MKSYLVFIFCFFLPWTILAQDSLTRLEIYQSFEERSFSSAGLYAKHLGLEKDSTATVELTDHQLLEMNSILRRAGVADYYRDRKDVTNAITFALADLNGEKVKLVFYSNRIIIDLTNRKRYFIREDADRRFIRTLIMAVKAKSQRTL